MKSKLLFWQQYHILTKCDWVWLGKKKEEVNIAFFNPKVQVVGRFSFLCLRTEGAGGIMFPGCPSVRPDLRPDFSFTR